MDTWWATLAESPWLYPVLFALVVGDAFLVVLPSETAVVALGALTGATGSPPLAALVPVAAAGAIAGDLVCFTIGRRLGLDRWRWQRTPRVRAALERVRDGVLARPAVAIFTARYVPFARIAVNLTAGASGLPYRRFVPLSGAAGIAWAIYNVAVGASVGAALAETPVLAIVVSVLVAITLGLLVDAVAVRVSRARRPRPGPDH